MGDRHLLFDAKLCTCGHVYGRHPWEDNPRRPGWCLECACRRRRDAVAEAKAEARRAIAADPAHVHGPTHVAYACPGWIPIQVCDACGGVVR